MTRGESPCTADFPADRPAASQLKQGESGHHTLCGHGSRGCKETCCVFFTNSFCPEINLFGNKWENILFSQPFLCHIAHLGAWIVLESFREASEASEINSRATLRRPLQIGSFSVLTAEPGRPPPRLDAWGKKQQTHGMAHPPHPSHPSEWREMTNGGGGPHFSSSGGQAGGSHSATRYKLKKQQQQRHRRRSSSPMGRVILINAPVDGEFRTWSCVSMATHTTALTVAAETCSEWPQIQVSTNVQMFQFPIKDK